MAQIKAKAKPAAQKLPDDAPADNLPALPPARLPYHPAIKDRFGVDKAEWKALCEAIFPLAQSTDAIILALSYCRARKLDPFKRVVHIVPIWSKEKNGLVDTIWPGIAELRTTAFRTREYAGKDETKWGPVLQAKIGILEIEFPEWAQVTVYRMMGVVRCAFPGPRVYWLETYARKSRSDESPNEMWARRSFGQLDKCAEAAALRAAFPEEIGGDQTADEMGGEVDGGDLKPDADGVYAPAAKGEPRPERDAPKPAPDRASTSTSSAETLGNGQSATAQAQNVSRETSPGGPPAADPSDPGPADPRRGEPAPAATAAGPGAIPLKGADFREWSTLFKKALAACTSDAAITALLNANAEPLAKMEKADSVRHETILEAVQERRDTFADDRRD